MITVIYTHKDTGVEYEKKFVSREEADKFANKVRYTGYYYVFINYGYNGGE